MDLVNEVDMRSSLPLGHFMVFLGTRDNAHSFSGFYVFFVVRGISWYLSMSIVVFYHSRLHGLILVIAGYIRVFVIVRAISWYFLSYMVVFCSFWVWELILTLVNYFMVCFITKVIS
jgi:hypothetical protein